MLELRMPPNVLEWPEMTSEENFSHCYAKATRALIVPHPADHPAAESCVLE